MAYSWNWEEKFRQEDEIIDMLENIRDNFPSAVAEELDAVWALIRDKAIELCPKESGALASSIELESEGGSGAVSASQGATIYENAIYAGNDSTFNFDGQPTSQYAQAVHDGHMMADGSFWEGVPFLEDALDAYESELDSAIDRAMSELLGD
ncbi:MAG: hypothetical protein ABSE15_00930 [Candidatus Bathyarchaeia archaeon]|jgi:hypothetical protein